jgi:arabinan endo-1,5-alpha-L-arabinosidase
MRIRRLFPVALLSLVPLTATGAAATASPAAATASPGTGSTFTNPVIKPTFADPSVYHDPVSGKFFAYGTTDQWTSDPSTVHILPIEESSDLVHWQYLHDTFRLPGSSPAGDEPVEPAWAGAPWLWAPEVHRIGGWYVMYYTASSTAAGGSAIGVATASSPAGPWQDSGGPMVGPRPDGHGGYYWTFDPNEIQAPSGQRYLYFGSFYGGTFVIPLTSDGLHVVTGATSVQVGANGRYEGTFVVQHGGYYYMFASTGNCCAGPNTGYAEFAGRSRSPLGPFFDHLGIPMTAGGGTIVLASNGSNWVGPGGVSVVQDLAGRDWMAFHAIDERNPYLSSGANARPMLLEPIEWSRDGWPAVNNGRGPLARLQPAPGTPEQQAGPNPLTTPVQPGPLLPAYSQDFTGTALGSQWSWVREDTANWSLTSDPGTLTIDAVNGDLYETFNTAQNILVEKAPPGDFVAQTKLTLRPDQNYEQAGLLLYQDDDHYFRLVGESNSGVDETEWAKETDVTSPYAGFSCGSGYPADTCPVYGSSFLEVPGFSPAAKAAGGDGTWDWLRIVRRGNTITPYTSIDGHHWEPGATYDLTGFDRSKPIDIGLEAITAGAAAVMPVHVSYVHVYALP